MRVKFSGGEEPVIPGENSFIFSEERGELVSVLSVAFGNAGNDSRTAANRKFISVKRIICAVRERDKNKIAEPIRRMGTNFFFGDDLDNIANVIGRVHGKLPFCDGVRGLR